MKIEEFVSVGLSLAGHRLIIGEKTVWAMK